MTYLLLRVNYLELAVLNKRLYAAVGQKSELKLMGVMADVSGDPENGSGKSQSGCLQIAHVTECRTLV